MAKTIVDHALDEKEYLLNPKHKDRKLAEIKKILIEDLRHGHWPDSMWIFKRRMTNKELETLGKELLRLLKQEQFRSSKRSTA